MRPNTTRHLRALRHTFNNPSQFFFKSSIIRWLLCVLLVGLVYGLFKGPFFRIKTVLCTNQDNNACDEVVTAELATHLAESIFTVNTKNIKQELEKANPAYQEVSVIAKLPNRLEVTMIDKVEYANLKIASNSATLLVDKNLLIVEKLPVAKSGIFTIIAQNAGSLGVGDIITDKTIVGAFKIAEELKKSYLAFSTITINSPTYIAVDLPEEKKAVFTVTKDISRQVTSLQLILTKATIAKEPQVYDMRFDKPVLK